MKTTFPVRCTFSHKEAQMEFVRIALTKASMEKPIKHLVDPGSLIC